MTKELKLKVRKFLGLIPTFLEIRGEKLVEIKLLCYESIYLSSLAKKFGQTDRIKILTQMKLKIFYMYEAGKFQVTYN